MQVTFRANSNFMGYKSGNVYTEELTPLLKAALLNDKHLSLIDPPTLEVRRPEPKKEIENKKKTVKETVENADKENDENGEREEDIQDGGSAGALGV